MSDELKPVRVMIGGPSGCVGYSQEELRVLESILSKGRNERTMIVHRAMRIMCQAMLETPDGGYPGSLADIGANQAVSAVASARVNAEEPEQAGEADAWLLEGSEKDSGHSEVIVDSTVSVKGDAEMPEPEAEHEPPPISDEQRSRDKGIASQFMG